jgi:peptide/nickel transport system substrate-binding protein
LKSTACIRAAALALFCSGCTHSTVSLRAAPHVLRIADWSEPASLDPLLAHDQETIGLDQLFVQTLVGLSRDGRLVPILVTEVPSRDNGGISADGRTIVYHLLHGVRFADGVPLTSRDVAFTFAAILDPHNPVLSQDAYRRIESLKTPDPHTVIIRLRSPWNAAVSELFAQSDFAFGILPAHAFSGSAVTGAPWENHAFGSGPFRVTEWRRGDRIVLEANPYFRPRPKLKRIEIVMIPNVDSVVVALRAAEVDAARLPPIEAAQVRLTPALHLISTPINGVDYLALQTTLPPTSDVRVRRAIADALDARLIYKAYHGLYAPAGAFLPPVLAWHDAALPPFVQNEAAAAAELDAAGWRIRGADRFKNGAPLSVLIVSQAGFSGEFAAIVQRELETAGIRAAIKTFPASAFNGPTGPLRTGAFNVGAFGWIGGGDPEQSVTFACSQIGQNGNNVSRYCNKRFDAAFEDQAVTPSTRQRVADFMTMQRLVYNDLPVVPLDYLRFYDAVDGRVSGFARNMLGYPVNAEEWDAR